MSYVPTNPRNDILNDPLITDSRIDEDHSNLSAVAWGAVLAGAAAIWLLISLLSGAFFAIVMAVFGGRQREE